MICPKIKKQQGSIMETSKEEHTYDILGYSWQIYLFQCLQQLNCKSKQRCAGQLTHTNVDVYVGTVSE